MEIAWGEFFDDLVSDKSWKNAQKALKDQAYKLIGKWFGADHKVLADAVRDALDDEDLSDKEVIGILSVVALDWVENNSELGTSFARDLLANLRDGELTATEIAEAGANWVATRVTTNENLRDLVKAGVNGKLSTDKVKEALYDWLEKRSGVSGLKEDVEKLLKSAKPVNLRSVVLLTCAYLIKDGVLKKASVTEEGLIGDLVKALSNLGKSSSLSDVFKALAEEDYAAAARLVIDHLGMDDDNGIAALLLQMLAGKDVDGAVQDFVAGALKRKVDGITDKQAGALAKTMLDVLNGKVELIPAQTEKERYGFSGPYYELWVEVRHILYAAKLAVAAAPVVSTDPMSRPHVFSAASIGLDTKIGSLAKEEDWPKLLEFIFRFSAESFGRRQYGEKFLTESPVNLDMVKLGATAERMHRNVRIALYP